VLDDNYQPDAVVVAYSFNTGFERLPDLQGADRQKFLHRVELKSIARPQRNLQLPDRGLAAKSGLLPVP